MRKSKIKNYWITPEMVVGWVPCKPRWNKKNVLAWFKGRNKVRFKTILKDENIDECDRNWVVERIYLYMDEIPKTWWGRSSDVTLDDIIAKIE